MIEENSSPLAQRLSRRSLLQASAAAMTLSALAPASASSEESKSEKLKISLITTHCDWFHAPELNFPWGPDGVKRIVDRYVGAGITRLCWRCTDGGTTHYLSKLRDPYHGLDADNCHCAVFMTENVGRYFQSDYRTFDSFAAAIEIGRKAGLEIYAWCQMAGEDDGFGYKSRRVKQQPEFCTVGRDGQRFGAKLGWAFPENHEYLLGLLKEVLAYKPDGVILDFLKNQGDYRDQLNDHLGVAFYGYEPPAVAEFKVRTGKNAFAIPNDDPEWVQCRADYVTAFTQKARALQKSIAPQVRWIAQVWGGGRTPHFTLLPREEYRRGGSYYRDGSNPVRDHLSGALCDIAAWTRNEAFDVVYPLPTLNQFDKALRAVQQLDHGNKGRIEAGGYVWDVNPAQLRTCFEKAVSMGVRELFLAESLPFETKQLWKPLQSILREFHA